MIPHPTPPQMMPQTIDACDADEDSVSSATDSNTSNATDSFLNASDDSNNSNLFECVSKSKMKALEKKGKVHDELKGKFKTTPAHPSLIH